VPRLSPDTANPTATDLQCSNGQPLPLHNTENRLVYLIRVSDSVAGASGRAVKDRTLAGIACLAPDGGTDVCLLCVVR